MTFGDGNRCFRALGRGLDVVAHEFTHGVTESTANLRYAGDAGALNESYSDVLGAMVDGDDWTMGEDVAKAVVGCPAAVRDLEDPTRFDQPMDTSEYFDTRTDNRGVHTNSGIPNHAAYLLAEDPVYGIGRADTAAIYYRALTTYVTATDDFVGNRAALIEAASDLFGAVSPQVDAVRQAQDAVGIPEIEQAAALRNVTPSGERRLRPGDPVVFSGQLVHAFDGTPVIGRKVEIQTNGGTFMSGRTNLNGRWTLRLPALPYNVSWRAVFRGGGDLGASAATPTRWLLVKPTLRAFTNLPMRSGHYKAQSGKRFLLQGSSKPRMWGAAIQAQYRWSRSGRWKSLGYARAGRDGRFGGTLRLSGSGYTIWIRHVYDGGKKRGWLDAESKPIAIDVR
jgi:hypothetical protein